MMDESSTVEASSIASSLEEEEKVNDELEESHYVDEGDASVVLELMDLLKVLSYSL